MYQQQGFKLCNCTAYIQLRFKMYVAVHVCNKMFSIIEVENTLEDKQLKKLKIKNQHNHVSKKCHVNKKNISRFEKTNFPMHTCTKKPRFKS